MKVYVILAEYCDETVLCGVAIDEDVAERIAECERNLDDIRPNCVYVEELDTDEYLPLNDGLIPYEARKYQDGSWKAVRESMAGFKRNRIYNTMRGKKCLVFEVLARDEDQALELAYELEKSSQA